jgi:hypothetical protein
LNPCVDLLPRDVPHAEAEREVIPDGFVWIEGITLKHHRQISPFRRLLGDVSSADQHAASLWMSQSGDDAEHRALPAS